MYNTRPISKNQPEVIQGIKILYRSLLAFSELLALSELALLLLPAFLELLCLFVCLIYGLACLSLVRFTRLHANGRADLAAFLDCIANLTLRICPVGCAGSNFVSESLMSA